MMTTDRILGFKVQRNKKGQTELVVTVEVEAVGMEEFGSREATLIISNELAYELAHKLQKRVEKAEGIRSSANGRKYSQFYGMNH